MQKMDSKKLNKANQFPDDFFWGSAFSGPQTEGINNNCPKSDSIWDYWFRKSPEKFYKQEFVKNDFWNRYKEDIDLAASLGFTTLRTSIQWTRLIPDGKNYSVEAVKHYREIFAYMKSKGIKPFVNLFHFDTPMWAQEIGGWTNKKVVDAFAEYADIAFKHLGDLVDKWITFNEPEGIFLGGYLYKFHYPEEVNLRKAIQVMWNTVVAHKKVVQKFRTHKNIGKIGSVLGISLTIPRSNNPEDVRAAHFSDLFKSKYYLNSIILNEFPKELLDEFKKYNLMPEMTDDEINLIKNYSMDFLGVNYYQPARAKAPAKENQILKKNSTLDIWFDDYKDPNAIINPHRGWEIKPEVIYTTLQMIKNEYGNIEHYVSECGMGVADEERFRENGHINDEYRIEFLKNHFKYVLQSIKDGSNTKGIHTWAYIDNWSWINAYKNRYGFIELNTFSGQRVKKKSSDFITKLATTNVLED